MRRVTVSIFGTDMLTDSLETEATSLFSAAEYAMSEWNRLWWFNPESLLEIRAGAERWKVDQKRVRDARRTKRV